MIMVGCFRLTSICVAALLLLALGGGTATATTPGEITGVEVSTACSPPRLGAAPGEGVLVRLCPQSEPGLEPEDPEGRLLGPTLVHVSSVGQGESIAVPPAAAGPILAGPRGELWLGASPPEYFGKGPARIQRIAPGGAVTSYPTFAARKHGIPKIVGMVFGADGVVWAAVGEGAADDAPIGGSIGGELVRIDAAGVVARFPIPEAIEPRAIALGADGNLWFTCIRGRFRAEHIYRPGVGFIGRITPGGSLNLFRVPHRRGDPTSIAAAPDGQLWFLERESGDIGTVRANGRFGSSHPLWWPGAESIAFGPEGDAWIGERDGLVRMTRWGQQTWFPLPSSQVALGGEGDVWGLSDEGDVLYRLVPGAPGIDLQTLRVDPGGRSVRVRLACGGSVSGCEGTLDLSLPTVHGKRFSERTVWPGLRFAHLTYAVAAESSRSLTLELSAKAHALIAKRDALGLTQRARVEATVTGGPSLTRTLDLPRS